MLQSQSDLSKFWNEMMQIPEARWIVSGTLLLFAVLIAVYVTFFFRNLAIGTTDDDATDLLTDFRRMRDGGHLQEEEYSKLKTVIPIDNSNRNGRSDPFASNSAGMGDEFSQRKKKFLTLAEAQQLKLKNQQTDNTNQDDEASDSE